jgi:hypothetical protein
MKASKTCICLLFPVLSAFSGLAAAQKDDLPPTYFSALAAITTEIHSVKWLADLCAVKFQHTAMPNQQAYVEWKQRHAPFLAEMYGQFDVLQRHWEALPLRLKKDGLNAERLKYAVEQSRPEFIEAFTAMKNLREICENYPKDLASKTGDIAANRKEHVEAVRRGPPAPPQR